MSRDVNVLNFTNKQLLALRSAPTLQKIESGKVWSPVATPTLQQRTADQEKLRDSLRLEDLKIATPKVRHQKIHFHFILTILKDQSIMNISF